MTMFTAYFDASGHPDGSPVLFVSGFVSTVEKWLRFETEWADLLQRYGIEGPFHMKEFAPGVGQYAKWKDDQPKRRAFLVEAIRILKHRTNKSFSSGVIIQDLAEVNRLYRLPRLNQFPYPLCAIHVIWQVLDWIARSIRSRRVGQADRIAFVFEDGDKHKGVLIDELDKLGVRPLPIFTSKPEAVPLQAADFVAWEHARLAKDVTKGGAWKIRGSFAALARQIPNDGSWGIHDKATLLMNCEKKNYPRRTGP